MKTSRMRCRNFEFLKLLLAGTLTIVILNLPEAFASSSVRLLSRSRRAVTSVTVREDAAIGDTLFDLNDQDAAKPLNSYTFAVVNTTGVSKTIFEINDNKLKIRDASAQEPNKFDREAISTIIVNIEATKKDNPNAGQKVLITVEITLEDVNDEPPVIINPFPFQAVVTEDTSPGTVIYTVTATDADSSSDLFFSLEPGSSQGFRITPNNDDTANIVTTRTDGFSDTESPMQIQVSVEDRGVTPSQKITGTVYVTVGTLAPQFYMTSYEGQIYENSAQQIVQIKDKSVDLLIQVIKFQPNNELSFEVSDNKFEIILNAAEPNQISLRSKEAFDFEAVPFVPLTVTAKESDTNYQSTAQVTVTVIDENDSVPKFLGKSQYFEQVPENEGAGKEIFTGIILMI
ncbi:hypothetical protein RRG08_012563 [Elysia crispata]|uniref:Cadherin domain-containing protein n=1 Tax=Elysia crispata TaxID=231223 RepID=A0AAE1AQB9_9GAST|nr:hypothetical protein RRG08_012563 [Elysia crispata]